MLACHAVVKARRLIRREQRFGVRQATPSPAVLDFCSSYEKRFEDEIGLHE